MIAAGDGVLALKDILDNAEAVAYEGVPLEFPDPDTLPDIDKKLCRFSATDLGNAERLIERYGRDMLWVREIGWISWTGTHWDRKNGDIAAQIFCHHTARSMRGEVLALGALGPYPDEEPDAFEKRIGNYAKFAKDSRNSGRLRAMLECAAPMLHADNDDMDQHHFLLNTSAGTLDLQSGGRGDGAGDCVGLRRHGREDKITRMGNVGYDPNAECPRFLQFLHDIQPERDIRQFLQRYFGYCLTGAINEQIVVMFYGQGSNGKSTLMDLINYILGDYALVLPFASLLQDDRRRGSEATPDLARLPGARFVTAAEPETGARFSESMLKQLTGGEKLTVRHLNKGFFEFYPQFKLCLSFNNKPAIRGQDDGIWRRIVLVPFDQKFVDKEKLEEFPGAKLKDRGLEKALRAEAPGILNWMLDGYRLWAESGLCVPERIRAATEQYKTESSPVQQFLAACVRRVDGGMVVASKLYDAYKLWCGDNAVDPVSQTAFGYRMRDAGYEKERGDYIRYRGIELTDDIDARLSAIEAGKFRNRGNQED